MMLLFIRSLSRLIAAGLVFFIISCQHEPFPMELGPIDPIDMDTIGMEVDTMIMDTLPEINLCNPDSVYFLNDILPIMQSSCALSGCHGQGSATGSVDLTSYSNVINTAGVVPYNLSESGLYTVLIESDANKRMPPTTQSPLNSNQISKIAQWILVGAPDNFCEDCDTTTISYSVDVFPVISEYCLGCHGAINPSAGIPLTTYEEIQTLALSGTLFETINHSAGYVPMPYNQEQLSQCTIDKIASWIEKGALDN